LPFVCFLDPASLSIQVEAAVLSDRYIADRFLPDKAVDLVDESASRLKMELDSKPTELDQLDRQILQLQIERTSLAKEKDEASRERLPKLDAELGNLRERSGTLTAQWQNEKTAINAVSILQTQVEQTRTELEQVRRRGDLTKAAEIQYGRLPDLERRLAEVQKQASQPGGEANAVGKCQSHHLDGRPDRVGDPARPCQTSEQSGRIGRAHHREGDVVGFFGIQGEEEAPRERIEIGHEDE
jgi:ATP-dependent Clp protease ATP-binding subunit ClpA